jgi:hypothetical protein
VTQTRELFLELASWVAPTATMIAAVMTAANLGSRVTGLGFAVFAVGAVGWIVQGIATGQKNLVISNAFLLLIDLIGVWRWLGQRARYDAGAQAAVERSAAADAPALMPLSKLEGSAVRHKDGTAVASVVDAMAGCDDGRVRYLVVRTGGVAGVGEALRTMYWHELEPCDGELITTVSADALSRRPEIQPEAWPARSPA